MPGYFKEVLEPQQHFRFKTLDRFLSSFGTDPRRLNEPRAIYLIISIKLGEGFCYIDNEPTPLTAGTLILVSPHSYLYLADAQYLLGSVLIFTEPFFCRDHLSESLLYKIIYEPKGGLVAQFGLTPGKKEFINDTIKMISMEYRLSKDKYGPNERINNVLSIILFLVHGQQLENIGLRYDPHNQYEKSRVVQFIKLLNFFYREASTVEFYADKMHTTVAQLTRDCKKGCGWTPKSMIYAKILSEAKRLLTHDQKPIGDIALDLGFEVNAAFTAFFKKHLGILPSQYRQDMITRKFYRSPVN